jgi:stage V sporulation protein B
LSLKQGTLYLMAGWSAILISGYFLNMVLARWFPTETFGNYGFVMAMLMWFEIFVINGMPVAVQKYVSARGKEAYPIFWTAVRVQATLIAVLTAVLLISAPAFAAAFRDPKLTPYFRLAFLNLPFYGFFHLLVSFQNGLRRFGKQAVCYAFYGSAKLGCSLTLCYFHRSLESALIGNAVGSAISLVLAFVLLENKKIHPSVHAMELVRFAAPALLYSLMAQLLMSVDFWSVKYFLGEKASGYYNTASILARIPFYLLAGLSATMLPTISSGISEGSVERVRSTIRDATRFSMMLLIPVSVLLTVYSRETAALLFKARYVPSGEAMEYLVWAFSAMALMTLFLTLINADGRPRKSFLIAGTAAAVDVAFNLALVPRMGIRGAAIASLIACGAGALLGAADVLRKFRSVPSAASAWKLSLATATLLTCVLLIRPTGFGFIWTGMLGTAAYGAVLLASGEIRKSDLTLLSVKSKAPGSVLTPPDSV